MLSNFTTAALAATLSLAAVLALVLSVAVAAMLTLFARRLLPPLAHRPAFIYTANAAGGGKTLLDLWKESSIMPAVARKKRSLGSTDDMPEIVTSRRFYQSPLSSKGCPRAVCSPENC